MKVLTFLKDEKKVQGAVEFFRTAGRPYKKYRRRVFQRKRGGTGDDFV